MDAVNTKPGAFPLGDRPNRYGILFDRFYDAWGKIHAGQSHGSPTEVCWPPFRGALAIAKAAAKRQGNKEFFDQLSKHDLTRPDITMMDLVMQACELVMNEIGSYDYQSADFDEETPDGVEEDVVSLVPEIRKPKA